MLTRAGSFTRRPDGTIVNAAGYALKGYPMTTTGRATSSNGFAGLEKVNLSAALLSANPTTLRCADHPSERKLRLGRDRRKPAVRQPGSRARQQEDIQKSITIYTNSGEPVPLDFYYTNVSTDAEPNKWEVAVFDGRGKSTGANRPFPYYVDPTAATPATG